MPTPAEIWQLRQRQVTSVTATAVLRAWERVRLTDPQRTFATVLPELLAAVTAGQLAAASGADRYVSAVVLADGLTPEPVATVPARRFAGLTSDGRTLQGLLTQPLIRSLYLRTQGADDSTALLGGRLSLRTLVRTEILDTGRDAVATAMALDRKITGYVRQVNLPACGRCIPLAGKFFRTNAGFDRHPSCFPSGVVVSGPATEAATRRWYEGELVVLTTASGQNLPLTGNHPVLTRRGWVPANLLHEGDEVVRSTWPEGAHSLVVPDHHEVPARIEDVWAALGVAGFDTVESSPEDFHGDGQHGQVHVVRADRSLDDRALAAFAQELEEQYFAVRSGASLSLDGEGSSVLLDLGHAAHARGPVRSGGLSFALGGGHLTDTGEACLAGSSAFDAGRYQASGNRASRNAVLARQGVFARPSFIGAADLLCRDVASLARWDAPGLSFSVHTAEGYARLGLDLLDRLAGQVELDRVVELRRVHWSGHVYSLTSTEGWHSANSLVVSNCDCTHSPTTQVRGPGEVDQEPRRLFDGMTPAQQDRAFGKDNAEVIRRGGDIGQVVNARRGMATAGSNWTTEGTTSRGAFGRSQGATQGRLTQAERVRESSQRAQATKRLAAPRPSPGALLRFAGDDPQTFARALERAGYL